MTASSTPNPAIPVPQIAWPTVALFAGAVMLWTLSTMLALGDALPVPAAVLINAVAVFLFFTVLHEASHRSTGELDWLNDWLGRLGAAFLHPLLAFRMFRFIHMQHHLHTNEDETKDPDAYTTNGPRWSWPLRWATLDFKYSVFYFSRIGSRPRREVVELAISSTVLIGAGVVLSLTGHFAAVLLYYLLPTRIAIFALGYSFDYLPHHGLEKTNAQDKYKATRNRVGLELLLTPLMLYQNYHLVHHLHPRIPFYSYIRAWRSAEQDYLAREPALSTVAGRPLSAEEYRLRRGLDPVTPEG